MTTPTCEHCRGPTHHEALVRCDHHPWKCPSCGAEGNTRDSCWRCEKATTREQRRELTQVVVTMREWEEYQRLKEPPP